jgi:hypothetical protein
MMKTNGPSHAVGYKSTKKQGWFLEGKQCVCADVISVGEIIKPTAPSPLTTAGVVRDVEKGTRVVILLNFSIFGERTFNKQRRFLAETPISGLNAIRIGP